MEHNAHGIEYEDYCDALAWEASCTAMRQAEGTWEDNGCMWVSTYFLSIDEDSLPVFR